MTILVVYKQTAWSQRSEKEQALIFSGDSTVSKMKRAHEAHMSCLVEVQTTLWNMGEKFESVHDITSVNVDDFDLVVTVGGDGTLLHVSHYVNEHIPVLAINSAPKDSIGFFCANNGEGPAKVLQKYKNKELRHKSLARMAISVNNEIVTTRALNDALFTHTNPACMTRYFLQSKELEPEEHMSSGIWISTAAGSNAAIRSAGGFTMPSDSQNIQYLVREPYEPIGMRLQNVHGFIRPNQEINIKSKIEDGMVYVDGPHIAHPVTRGETLSIKISEQPLHLVGFRRGQR